MQKIKFILSAIIVLLVSTTIALAQTKVSGVVKDKEGLPVIGATVMISDKAIGTSTNEEGEFSLQADSKDILEVNIIGYKSKKVPIDGKKFLEITIEEDNELLEATVVVGYGSAQKIGNIVGSVKNVQAGELIERPSANIGDALQGQVAGMQIFSGSGEPESDVNVNIHGSSSLNLSNTPLFIVDGVPVSGTVFTTINPQDIENIAVLKDASSTAIYGSRAANGVIFITTKKGKKGEKPSISLRAQYGMSQLADYRLKMMNSKELLAFEEKCMPKLKTDPEYQAKKNYILKNNIDFDWKDYLFDDAAPMFQADLSIRGASEKTAYYISAGYYSEKGTFKEGSNLNRGNLRTNIDSQLNDWLKVGSNIALAYSKYSNVVTGWYNQSPMMQAVTNLPYEIPYEMIEGEDGKLHKGDRYDLYPWNGSIDLIEYYKQNPVDKQKAQLTAQLYQQITPIKGLTIRTKQAVDGFYYTTTLLGYPSYVTNAGNGINRETYQRYIQISSTNTIEYKTQFGEHFLTLLAGHESIMKTDKNYNVFGEGLTDDRTMNFGSATKITHWGGYQEKNNLNSFFFNVNYDWKDRYFLDASIRTDGSSLFGKDYKYATFYSIGGMWKAKEEAFLKDVSWLTDLKFNLSYGTTGNSAMRSWYPQLGLVGTKTKYNGELGWYLQQVESPELTWETVGLTNFTVNARFFDRFGFDLQVYNKQSKDLLMEIPFSATTGHESSWGNVAAMYNRGFDFELTVDILKKKDLFWGFRTNVNYNKNRITKLYNGLDELSMPNAGLKYQVGKSSTLIYTPVRIGVDPEDGAPIWANPNGGTTKEFSDDLMQFWGKDIVSPWSGGFSTNFSWKGLGINADFSWIGERWVFINERFYTRNPKNQLFNSNFETIMKDIWTEPGQKTSIPKFGTDMYMDTAMYSNAAFLRLKNLSISYTLPKQLFGWTLPVNSAKLYVTGRNLLTITGFQGYDPEVGVGNSTQGLYPNSKQYVFGVEISF